MDNSLIAHVQRFTLEARHNLEREGAEQLEGIYGWTPDGRFAAPENYPALKQLQEARETREMLEAYAAAEKEVGFDSRDSRQRLVRESAFTWLNRLVALRMMEERRLLKVAVSRLHESNAYIFWLADEVDPEARGLHERGEMPVNPMGEGPRNVAYRRFLIWLCGELAREASVLFDPSTLASRLLPRPRVLRESVSALNDDDIVEAWRPGNEETIGWIYQVFNSEEKEAVFDAFSRGKKVTPEQIAPATQIFTPRWIVRFLVENSLGRLWLGIHPDSRFRESLGYLVPSETVSRCPPRLARDITFLDPACGSMHFGLVAFDLFAEMYEEELTNAGKPGWPQKPSVSNADDIPEAIIAKNLHGIDVDLRAVQLSALTLFLRARTMNPRCVFTDANLACANVQQITGGRLDEFIRQAHFSHPIYERILRTLAAQIKDSDSLGSLLRPEVDLQRLVAEERRKAKVHPQQYLDLPGTAREQFRTQTSLDAFFGVLEEEITRHLDEFVRQSRASGQDASHFSAEAAKGLRFLRLVQPRYDVVATNPPYMSRGNQSSLIADFLSGHYDRSRNDLYTAFIERCMELGAGGGRIAMITQQSFMFITSYQNFRAALRETVAVEVMVHLGAKAFEMVGGEVVNTTAFVLRKETEVAQREGSRGQYIRLVHERDPDSKRTAFESTQSAIRRGEPPRLAFRYQQRDFDMIPGKPWVYWMPKRILGLFSSMRLIEQVAEPRVGLQTGDNKRFLRYWWEIGRSRIGFGICNRAHSMESGFKWFPCMKGGERSPWFGSQESVVDWLNDGAAIRCLGEESGRIGSRPQNTDFYFRRGVTWNMVSTKSLSVRFTPDGFIYDHAALTCFPSDDTLQLILAVLNSRLAKFILSALNPTMNYEVGDVERMPVPGGGNDRVVTQVNECIELVRLISCESETTHGFVQPVRELADLAKREARLIARETEIDSVVCHLYGLMDEDLAVIDRELSRADMASGSSDSAEASVEEQGQQQTRDAGLTPDAWARSWISYAAGVVLGRFEIGVPGGLGCGDFSPDVVRSLKTLTVLDGILASDPGQPLDLAARVWQALETMLGAEDARTRVGVALGDGDPLELLSGWFDRFGGEPSVSFWRYHLQSSRNRPVYWPIQSPERHYTVWVFHERLTRDTLFHIRNDIVEPRLRLAELEIVDLQARAAKERRARKELDRLRDFSDDLREFSKRLKALADHGYNPHIDDGVLINAAPLYEILPSWPETGNAWRELEKGKYDWAHQAMDHWPVRVRERCRTNRSWAIAHGLEHLCSTPKAAGGASAPKRQRNR